MTSNARALLPQMEREQSEEGVTDLEAMQTRRLEEVNRRLREHGLPPLKRTGNFKRGEEEVVRVKAFHLDTDWFVLVEFETREPITGNARVRYVRYSRKDGEYKGICALVLLNGEIVLAKQHRVSQLSYDDSWLWEAVRQFPDTATQGSFMARVLRGDPTLNGAGVLREEVSCLLGRELGALVADRALKFVDCDVLRPDGVGDEFQGWPEDTGFFTSRVHYVRARLQAPPEVVARIRAREYDDAEPGKKLSKAVHIKIVPPNEAFALSRDQHTRSALLALAMSCDAIDYNKIR